MMGFEVENVQAGPHVQAGAILGYSVSVHRGSMGYYGKTTDCPWAAFRAAVLAARDGTDAQLDAAAITAWGASWADVVLSRGQRPSARAALAGYLPAGVPVP